MSEVVCPRCAAEVGAPCRRHRGRGAEMTRRHSERVRAEAVVAQVARFNAVNPAGSEVLFWPGLREGEGRPSRTRTPAWVMGGHTAVVSVEGYPGGISLTHVEMRDAPSRAA